MHDRLTVSYKKARSRGCAARLLGKRLSDDRDFSNCRLFEPLDRAETFRISARGFGGRPRKRFAVGHEYVANTRRLASRGPQRAFCRLAKLRIAEPAVKHRLRVSDRRAVRDER